MRAAWRLQAGALLLGAGAVCAQSFPVKPVRIIAAEAGSPNDVVARMVAAGMSTGLGQPVVVDNRGGGGIIQPEIVSKAAPDGYTLMFLGAQLWLLQYLRSSVPYQMSEFRPISLVTTSPGFLVLHPSVAANSVKELIALAKARPGQLNFSTGSAGTITHLAPELFKFMTGVNIVMVPYRGGASAVNAVLAGEVQLMISTPGGVIPHIRAGRLKGLAVTSAQPSALFPELPTVAASGLPGFEAAAMIGMLGPAKTPTNVVARLNQEIVRTVSRADVKDKLFNSGVEVVGSSPDEFDAKIKSEMDRMGKVIKSAGIRLE